ncbi:hypothetical protein KUCAC02_020248 [Chaenocephalus aceratus]|uniref:Uncharacterized protein n=1 Tax=Chaenocephalus aceratus TaxID=36190 RepID=A0ACB9VSM6_CHAAC|nr:hypothetical protein KUCAC02_020248 [Chaenocephalus aceratus]
MSDFHNRSQTNARRSDYVWQYEYYDDEEPVSFEGLKAHRYSIVIGFWVGLAVFVIFMFFVLTLLTKTGAPHQENPDSAEKRHRPGSCLVDIVSPQDENDKAFSPPLLAESRTYFISFLHKRGRSGEAEIRGGESRKAKRGSSAAGGPRGRLLGVDEMEESSTLGDDDLLYEPSAILERQSHSHDAHCDIH